MFEFTAYILFLLFFPSSFINLYSVIWITFSGVTFTSEVFLKQQQTEEAFRFWWVVVIVVYTQTIASAFDDFFLIINSLHLKIVLWHACAQQTIIHWFFWKYLRLCNWFQSSVVFLGMLLTRKERSLNITQRHQSVVRKLCHKNLYGTRKRFFIKILTFIALKLGYIRLCIWSLAIRWS